MRKLLILLSFLFSVINLANAEEHQTLWKNPKNGLYVSAGALYFSSGIFHYERQVFTIDNRIHAKNYTSYIRVSAGTLEEEYSIYRYGSISSLVVFDSRKSHLEIAAGIAMVYDKEQYESYTKSVTKPAKRNFVWVMFSPSVGYRFQKPQGHFIFRSGIGWPEGVYVSLGLAF